MKIKSWHFFVVITALVYILPILLANVYYADDMFRAESGYGWDGDGRIFANLLIHIISFGNGIVSIFPFSLLLSALFFSIAGMVSSYVLLDDDPKLRFFYSLIFITSPFLLENLAFKFDSLPMAISVLLAVSPYLIKNKYAFSACSIVCLTIVLGLYQTSAMLYFGVALCLMIKKCMRNEEAIDFKLSFITIFSFFSAYFIYSCLLSLSGLIVSRAAMLHLNIESIDIIVQRIKTYFYIYKILWKDGYYIAVMPIILLAITSISLVIKKKENTFKVFMICIYLACILLLTALPNLILESVGISPRTFICFPLFIYAIVVIAKESKLKMNNVITQSCLVILFSFSFLMSSLFGQTLKNSDEYANYIAESVSNDITENSSNNTYNVVISGNTEPTRNNRKMLNSFGFLNLIAPNYMKQGWMWGVFDIGRYIDINFIPDNQKYVDERCSWDVIKKRSLYYILKKDDVYMIDFNYKACIK